MKREERQKMKELEEKYYNRMDKINSFYDDFIRQADNFRMKCVYQISKLMREDKELSILRTEAIKIYNKNKEKRKNKNE